MIQKLPTAFLAVIAISGLYRPLAAAELAPDDQTIAAELALWLRNPDIDYDAGAGQWTDSSGNGNDATSIGVVGGVTWSTPTLANLPGDTLTPNELASVHFAGSANDILATSGLNGGSGLSELTIITIYAVSDRDSLTRPLGFGSVAATQANPGDHFNLAGDPSIRKDNGAITGHSATIPINRPFIRSARLGAGGADEWFNSDGVMARALTSAGASYTTSTDRFYLGDLRCGSSPVPGFGAATSTAEIDLIEVLVYRAALTETQIADINGWLVANLGGMPPPVVTSFTASPSLIASGEPSTLEWEVERADSVTITPSVGAVASAGSTPVTPSTTTTYTLTATGEGGETTAQVTIGVDVLSDEPIINEVLASNANSIDDEDGDSSDWIEIHNPNAFDLDLGGYFLSDSPLSPTRWQIPAATVIAGGGHLVVFASGKDRTIAGAELHTNFRLDSAGEGLRLIAPDGTTPVSELSFPAQITDISYGIDESDLTRFLLPTPGAPNGSGFDGRVADTRFSVDRGFYDTPQNVAITTATPGAEIRYTTDGNKPTATTGTVYLAPVAVTTTTTLRAAAFKPGLLPTNVDTHTYIFLSDVIRQPANPAGAPSSWGNRTPDYAMDPDVVDDPAYSGEIIDGLKSIRTLSIVVPNDEFFNNPRGIYANPQNDGRAWEREVSFEFLHPDEAGKDVQANGGIRIHGNGSRSANGQPKHGFRVEFRGEYGTKKLRYKLFPDTNVDEFDSLILRGQNAHGWTRSSQIANNVGTSEREQSQYIRDSFARDLMKGMGQTSGEATYVHLYINGLYWGLYNPVEYPRAAYGASHFGGGEDDYDSINRRTTTTKILDGTFAAWGEMQALANSGLTTREKYEQMEAHINIDNLIDYMLMHQYMGSRDGPEVFNSNNMRAIRNTRGDNPTTWIGMPWDMEASMFEIDVTRNVNVDDPNTLVRVYTKLRENPEFRLRYADRARRHCFNGGTLTPGRSAAIWEARASEISTAIIGESARWGDFRRPAQPFTRDAEWQQERDRLLTSYFPTRTDFLINLLRQNDLYPDTSAPDFTSEGSELTINAPSGTIYYTLDGTDPREMWTGDPVGILYSGALTLTRSAVVRARTLDGGEWLALTQAEFLVGRLATPGDLLVSEIMYNPAGDDTGNEFLELANISGTEIDLSGVHFGAGIDFTVPTGTVLPAGGFLTISSFGNNTSLDNDGETITLLGAAGTVIESFRYEDGGSWPSSPDGSGPSLTRILRDNDPNLPSSWRPSVASGGSPGSTDAIAFSGDPDADADGDGLSALLEHALGTSDLAADEAAGLTLLTDPGSLTIRQSLSADDILWTLEASGDLSTWTPVDTFLRTTDNHFDGTRSVRYSALETSSQQRFWRARIELAP